MANSKKCEHCGARLDFGEKCLCGSDIDMNLNTEVSTEKYYRVFTKQSTEQKLEQLNMMKAFLQ